MKCKEIQKQEKVNLQLKNNKMQKIKEKGITLIALVVTIIILLILVGVTVSQISENNGLFQRTRQAVEKYKNASEEEQMQLEMIEQYASNFSLVGENKEITAVESDVLSPKTFLAKDGSIKTGTMKNNGEINETLSAGEEKQIPAGYTSGGVIKAGTEEVDELKKNLISEKSKRLSMKKWITKDDEERL